MTLPDTPAYSNSNVIETALGIDCIEFMTPKMTYFTYKIMLLIYC